MISVDKALQIVLDQSVHLQTETIALENVNGRVLGENIISDIDMPPFARSMMDGFAVRSADVADAPTVLKNIGFIPAGTFPGLHLHEGEIAKIMTGAPLPEGADSVREIEKTKPGCKASFIKILEPLLPGMHVVPKGAEIENGKQVLEAGLFITPAIAGVLATVGITEVCVFKKPTVSILSTGDELVSPAEIPGPGQIRDSNSYTLLAHCQCLGIRCEKIGIAKDQRNHLQQHIARGLESDVLLISGGVSMGDLDFVKDVFESFHLKIWFSKVAIKPGKPTIFATHPKGLVFGLPGNPVSGATVFEVFVRPALRKISGFKNFGNFIVESTIIDKFSNKSSRTNYHPAFTFYERGEFFTRPIQTKGSGDITSYSKLNSFLICPAATTVLEKGGRCKIQLSQNFDLI